MILVLSFSMKKNNPGNLVKKPIERFQMKSPEYILLWRNGKKKNE